MAKYKDYPTFDDPPFDLKGVREVVSKKVLDRGDMISHSTGEIASATWWKGGGVTLKDTRPYIKMFRDGQDVMMRLSHSGTLVLICVLSNLKPHTNTFTLTQKEVTVKHKNLLGGGYYKGVCELLDYGVIAKTKRSNEFFINTNMFFNGDRIKWQKIKMQEMGE